MKSSILSSLALPFLLQHVSAQFLAAPTDLTSATGYSDITVRYKQVPEGICELTPGVKSYSGYLDVEEDQHLFFWFFEARNQNPHEAPLTVWINGGPGSSSMIGLFQELGPCGVDFNGDLYYNPYAWNNVSNMLFIDQPAQTGFSYSVAVDGYVDPSTSDLVRLPSGECPNYAQAFGTCGTFSNGNVSDTVNSTANGAPQFWNGLQGFMGAFPQYSRHGFHFATESYGGHYGPVYNEYIEMQNAKIKAGKLPKAKKIKLESVIIGNGWYDPLIQYAAYYNFTVYPGNTYDYKPFNQSIDNMMYNAMYGKGNCHDQIMDCYIHGGDDTCSAADNFCAYEVELVLDNYASRDEYDIRELSSGLSPDPFPYSFFRDYLNTPKVQKAVGAYVNFTDVAPDAVGVAFGSTGDDGRESHTIEDVRALVEQGIYVVQYAGDADYNCNWLGGQVVASEINAPGYATAGYVNITTTDHVVHGQVKQANNFAFARIYESGHEVPFYQPLAALELFERVLCRRDIATGTHGIWEGVHTQGPQKSTYREGNGTVVFEFLPLNATYNTTTNRPNGQVELGKRGEMVVAEKGWNRATFGERPSRRERLVERGRNRVVVVVVGTDMI